MVLSIFFWCDLKKSEITHIHIKKILEENLSMVLTLACKAIVIGFMITGESLVPNPGWARRANPGLGTKDEPVIIKPFIAYILINSII